MKKWIIISFIVMIFLIPAYSYSADLGFLRISLIEGDVQLNTEDTSDWVPAAINMPLRESDRLWVPEAGRVELQLRDGTYLRLDENSSVEILAAGLDSFQFYLNTGRAYVNFRGLRKGVIQIDTPVSSIRAYEKTTFRIDVVNDSGTEVSVFKGIVYVESRSGGTNVGAGKALSIRGDAYAELYPLGPSDEWERWNRERDRRLLERKYSYRYLPDELGGYYSDFEDNGRWVYVREYGYVWTPTVIVSVGWAPYRHGRWVWIGGDYVWVSYEPWGWVPYHYGRWSFVGSIGWCWVPPVRGAVYWGPGFVGWVHTPTYVAWVPLAPGEIYYGYGNYGPHSVNIYNIDIHKTVIKNVYKNVYVNNAVTVLHHDTFVRGKHVDYRVKENPFLKEKISVGRPLIKPEKATVMPVVRDVPYTKQPPKSIRDIHVKDLKEKRPLVKERKASVMTPGSSQKKMAVRSFKEPKGGISTQERSVRTERATVPEKTPKVKEPSVKERAVRPAVPERATVPEKTKKVKEPSVKEKAVRAGRPGVTAEKPATKGTWVPAERPAVKEKAPEIKEPLTKERWVKERWVPAEKPAATSEQRRTKEPIANEKWTPTERQGVTEGQRGFR